MTNCKHFASAALQQQYGGQGCDHHAIGTAVVNTNGSNLPFTGSDLKLFILAGVALIVIGILVRKLNKDDGTPRSFS